MKQDDGIEAILSVFNVRERVKWQTTHVMREEIAANH